MNAAHGQMEVFCHYSKHKDLHTFAILIISLRTNIMANKITLLLRYPPSFFYFEKYVREFHQDIYGCICFKIYSSVVAD